MRMQKNNCYFYSEHQEMSANIPTCTYHDKIGYCPCDNCCKFIHKEVVRKSVIKLVNSINNSK